MRILSIECSASPASAAVTENGKILSSAFINIKTTHSQTLMSLIKSVLDNTYIQLSDIDALAVSCGPGSFTGIRIGISAIKGLAEAKNIPCFAVSTLRCIAENIAEDNIIINAVMDARCSQFYNALFIRENGKIKRLSEDRALLHSELLEELKLICSERGCKYISVGDGADLFSKLSGDDISHIAVEPQKYQNAAGVGLSVFYDNLTPTECDKITPVYLRLPQAERELKRKQEEKL